MDFHQLKCFREVAITQSCSQAATNLGMSRSRVRFVIKELEEALSIMLFEVDSKNDICKLTEHGKKLLKYANQLAELENEAKSLVNGLEVSTSREVHICYNENLLHSFLPATINRFLNTHSAEAVDFKFRMCHSQEDIIGMFREGRADLAFVQGVPSKEVNYIQLSKDQLYILLPRAHPLANKKRLRLQDLADIPLIMPSLDYMPDSKEQVSNLSSNIISMLEAEHLEPVVSRTTSTLPGRIAYVQAGMGYTIVSDCPHDEEQLASIEIDNPYSRRNIYMLWPKSRKLSPAAEDVRAFCVDYFKHKHDIFFN